MSLVIEPYRIDVTPEVLADLRDRLARTRFPEAVPGAGWDYGTDATYLRDLVEYWRHGYDWQARQDRLNAFEHFVTEVDGARVHFVHAPSPEPGALPLVLTHGWPGSIVEFLDVIDALADPASHGGDPADAFHVVCPSIPGYTFSGPTRERGWDPARVARAWAALMAGLGYGRYGAQGGDWGAFVTREVAFADPGHCVGIHLNMWPPTPGPDDDPAGFTADEQDALADFASYLDDGSGYQRIQSTRPHTLGFALEDSPAGLAAWIVEKVRAWSDCGGTVEHRFSKDALLDNVMCYWVTATATSSARLYAEFDRALRAGAVDLSARVEVPTGYARYPAEIMRTSRRWNERQFPIVHYAEMPRGGHFAAWEEPQLFVDDVRACFRVVRRR